MSLMFGVARSLQAEYPSNLVLCLDVESTSSAGSLEAIDTAIRHITSVSSLQKTDSEFVERDGMYHVSRVVADAVLNKAKRKAREGKEEESHLFPRTSFTTTGPTSGWLVEGPLAGDEVEVEVHAAGMNFKDLANAMGFPLGALYPMSSTEIEAVSPTGLRNRWHAVHPLPNWVSFEAGTSLGIAVHTAVYGLVTLATFKRDSLSSSIPRLVKSDRLPSSSEQYGIPRDHMFSSRSTVFAKELMRVTNGRGVDVCLNSLTGDMLHESWRCIAENGTLVEIGKRDMLDRNGLSMEPYNRNCSYRALDLSRKSISDETTYQTGVYIMDQVKQRHIIPLHIGATFPFTETVEAFRYNAAWSENLVVICRSGYEDARSQKIIYDYQCLGCHVERVTGDISCLDDVRHA
ncbi:uncharacterized protein BDW70DRAFT_163947 [Aspergillus foveolatus]|uniref:uncharacterized protein n=1 Tax=Aspergillus foveolatus TaxID=210207 RepID=UPI003CCDC5A1